MSVSDQADVTALLRAAGSPRARVDALLPVVYDHLRLIARNQLGRERRHHTLSATALTHEAYARLAGLTRIEWRDRAHFFAAAAGAMRRVLINHAVARRADKRGAGRARADVDLEGLIADDHLEQLLVLDAALTRLERTHEGAARIVECRVFAGMTVDETAEAVGVSPATVKRHWQLARRVLAQELASLDD
jgi:RNA polymerase sigma factor (TIGR02999 family)